MFRRFRHKLFLLLQAGIIASGVIAIIVQPSAWRAVLITALGAVLVALICGRYARRHLHATLGRLRRLADDVGRGRHVGTLIAQPGDDMYKLTTAINVLAVRLAEASREEKRLHEELRRRERLAFLGELAATVAHEVNNPLDGVQNCARILRRSQGDPQRAGQMLDLIDSGLGRIELIVRRLLTLARDHDIRPTEEQMGDVIEGAIEVIRPKIDGRQIKLARQYETDDDATLLDRALLEQVFVNLALNAADSMLDGGTLTFRVRREAAGPECADAGDGGADGSAETRPDEAREFICVDVADTGTGISEDVLPHIFEPFFTTKPGGKGTGLGLAIASRIVDAHQGSIEVCAGESGGTVFTVRIPVLAAGAADESSAEIAAGATLPIPH